MRLFEHCGIATGDDFNLSRTKKQLQVEFNVAQSGFIEVNGYTYTRHDVLEEIDRPDFLIRLGFHKQLWNSPAVLQLLENNTFNSVGISDEFKPLWNNKEFDEFFSPYFAGPFNYISRTLLTGWQVSEMSDLLAYEDFLLPDEREEAFQPIRLFFDDNVRLLRNINSGNYKMMRPKIVHWIDTDWHAFFNSLPHEFDDAKYAVVSCLVNIGVAIQKTHRRDCRKISEQLILLRDTPESLRSVIVSNHVVYTRGRRFSFQGRSPFWLIWVALALFRLVSNNGCNDDKPDYNNFKPVTIDRTYLVNDSSQVKKITDSIVKANKEDTAHIHFIQN